MVSVYQQSRGVNSAVWRAPLPLKNKKIKLVVVVPVGSVGKPAPARRGRTPHRGRRLVQAPVGKPRACPRSLWAARGRARSSWEIGLAWPHASPSPCCPQRPSGAALSTDLTGAIAGKEPGSVQAGVERGYDSEDAGGFADERAAH